VAKYLHECADYLFVVHRSPFWVVVDAANYQLQVTAPNMLSSVGEHVFQINDWLVSVHIEAPCSTKNIQGLDDDGSLTMLLDDEVTLVPQL